MSRMHEYGIRRIKPNELLCLLLLMGIVVPGCSSTRAKDLIEWVRPKTSADYLNMALESNQADVRRRGVIGLSESNDAQSAWAVKVFDTIARTDTDVMVRCAALRALKPVVDAERIPTALKLLRSADEMIVDVRPAPPTVRWSAARLLWVAVRAGAYREDQRESILDTLSSRLAVEADPNTRLAMVETLGYFQNERVLPMLIDAMEQDDFAAQHAAENALAVLTGQTYGHDPAAWRQWLGETDEPFAHAGEMPEELVTEHSKPKWDWLAGW